MAPSRRAPPLRWLRSAHHRRSKGSRRCRHAVAEITTRSRNDRDWDIVWLSDRTLKDCAKIIYLFHPYLLIKYCRVNAQLST